jgi:putative ABC transport system permease protein
VLRDFQVAWRFLLKRRVATAVTVLTLGIAVASSTVAIGALDNAFWRSVDAPDGGGLLTIYNTRAAAPQYQPLTYDDYTNVRDRLHDRVDVAAFFRTETTLEGVAEPARIRGELVSDNYFRVLAPTSFMGRFIGADATARQPVIVLSYDTWRNRFGGKANIVGSSIQFGQNHYTVIGVAPPGFHGPAYPTEFWGPLAMTVPLNGYDLAGAHSAYLQTIARPSSGVARQEVQSYVRNITTAGSRDGWTLAALPGNYLRFWPAYRAAVTQFVGVFTALAIGILVIACANVAAMQLARGAERGRELAVRQALGGTRLHLLRRLAAESVVLTAAGGGTGVLLAWWSSPFLQNIPMPVPAPVTVTFDWRLVATAVTVSLAASLAFTVLAAWKGVHADVQHVLASSSRGFTGKTLGQRLLVVAQLSIGCVVATAAALLLRSLWNVQRVDVGFDPSNRVAAYVSLDAHTSASQAMSFYSRLRDALERTPGVEDVAFESQAVLERMRVVRSFRLPHVAEPVSARTDAVSPGYFRALGIPLVSGRDFDDRDTAFSERIIIVNETMAKLLGNESIDQVLIQDGPSVGRARTAARIVGVVRDVQYNYITEPAQPYVYQPVAQSRSTDMEVYLHSRLPTEQAIAQLREQVHRVDPQVALTDVGSLTDRISAAEIVPRSSAVASMVLALIAVFLAFVGVYGVMTTSMENQRRELAIRSALGASPSRLVRRIISEGTVLTSGALIAGAVGSVAGARAMAGLLFRVQPHDLVSLVAAVCLVLVASAVAWIGPARRAASVDPITVLRAE